MERLIAAPHAARSNATFGADAGQSLVEVGLALPILLLLFLGAVDLGRVFVYTISTTNAAYEGALLAARDPLADCDAVASRVAMESSFTGVSCDPSTQVYVECWRGAVACAGTTTAVDLPICPTGDPRCLRAADVHVHVRYSFSFVTGYLVDRVFHVDALPIVGLATVTRVSE